MVRFTYVRWQRGKNLLSMGLLSDIRIRPCDMMMSPSVIDAPRIRLGRRCKKNRSNTGEIGRRVLASKPTTISRGMRPTPVLDGSCAWTFVISA
jgi:hypothetical protein